MGAVAPVSGPGARFRAEVRPGRGQGAAAGPGRAPAPAAASSESDLAGRSAETRT